LQSAGTAHREDSTSAHPGARYRNCMKPQIASKAAITKPIHDSDIGTEYGPMCTAQRLNTLMRWATATRAKIAAETAA